MVFFACGLNHKTAPLSIREQVTRTPETHAPTYLPNHIHELVYLSTCNRTEIYCEADNKEAVIEYFSCLHHQSATSLVPYLYLHENEHAIFHALKVASGLDSMMIGEPQIFGQLKSAYQEALQQHHISSNLRRYFQFIFSSAKRIRHQSGINQHPVSVASVAAQYVKLNMANLSSLKILVIGSGDTGHLVAKYLFQMGVREFYFTSRTQENATRLANNFNAKSVCITEFPDYLPLVDVVITATACPMPFITVAMIKPIMPKRVNSSLLMLDLAVPRDIECDVEKISGVKLINIDNLHLQIEQGLEARKKAALHAEHLLNQEMLTYENMNRSLQAKEAICDYRSQMNQLANQELERALQKINQGLPAEEVLSEFSQRLVNKLTHSPTVGLRQAAVEGREELFELAEYLFNYQEYPSSYEKIS